MSSASLRRLSAGLVLLVPALALTACGPGGGGPRSAGTVAPPTVSPLDAVVEALNQGDTKGAQKQLRGLLKTNPNDPQAKVLAESIDSDPVQLLGAKSFDYTVLPGDTMVGLSQRFLGNRLKFYQLSRYNKIDKPATLAAGTVLHIPGEAPRPAAPAKPDADQGEAQKPKPVAKPRKAPPAPPAAAAPAARAPATNPAAALRLRGLGLAALNQGKVANAVGLLRRASTLDPANPLIARDLAKAERIAQAVQARR